MAPSLAVEELLRQISALDRRGLTDELTHFRGRFRLDFSDEYLRALPEERLRHILAAALMVDRTGG